VTASTEAQPRSSARLFDRAGWWDENDRAFASLRSVNAVRLSILRAWMRDWFPGGGPNVVVDFGCGGGLMSAPLAADGARVLGLDMAHAALRDASVQSPTRSCYVQADLSAPVIADGCADLCLLCDVLEHVADPAAAVAAAAKALRPGGALFVNTINRTRRATWLAVRLGEGLGLVPKGTHDPCMFVKPSEVMSWSIANGMSRTHELGERPRLLASLVNRRVELAPSRSMAVSYCMGFQKVTR
jgi:2-polyprenyl-6-hydroxyphenyl methylase / 3-demethylubiquinone-9 3-methyltransferase